jgi:hypothetical protein
MAPQPPKPVVVPPIKKLVLPTTLGHITPGELPANMLVDIKPFGKLHPRAANAYNALRAAAFAAGIKQFKPIRKATHIGPQRNKPQGFYSVTRCNLSKAQLPVLGKAKSITYAQATRH